MILENLCRGGGPFENFAQTPVFYQLLVMIFDWYTFHIIIYHHCDNYVCRGGGPFENFVQTPVFSQLLVMIFDWYTFHILTYHHCKYMYSSVKVPVVSQIGLVKSFVDQNLTTLFCSLSLGSQSS